MLVVQSAQALSAVERSTQQFQGGSERPTRETLQAVLEAIEGDKLTR
jgi:hypothetical protein